MPQNFIVCDREQALLLPPSLREWLPEDHLAWFVLDAVAEFNLEPFFASYRRDHSQGQTDPVPRERAARLRRALCDSLP